jgi:hypothetical protein
VEEGKEVVAVAVVKEEVAEEVEGGEEDALDRRVALQTEDVVRSTRGSHTDQVKQQHPTRGAVSKDKKHGVATDQGATLLLARGVTLFHGYPALRCLSSRSNCKNSAQKRPFVGKKTGHVSKKKTRCHLFVFFASTTERPHERCFQNTQEWKVDRR